MLVTLSNLQNQALTAIKTWLYRTDEPVFYLAGYAGTGKTTLLKTLDHEINMRKIYCAFTGKATHNLKKHDLEAVTLDKLIYYHLKLENVDNGCEEWQRFRHGEIPQIDSTEWVVKAGNASQDAPILRTDLIIVDECSMINKEYVQDLLSYKKRILVVGDPAQLEPVGGNGFFLNIEPDFTLNEIHRQAADSGIIQLATAIRNDQFKGYANYNDVEIVSAMPDFETLDFNETQFISKTHTTRYKYNRFIRLKYFGPETSPFPLASDKLICLRNHPEQNIFNGQQVFCTDYYQPNGSHIKHGRLQAIDLDTGDSFEFKANNSLFEHYISSDFIKEQTELVKNSGLINREHVPFDYGYCITCHKAQGSQWDDVYLAESNPWFQTKAERNKWLYTAVTRAAKKLYILKK